MIVYRVSHAIFGAVLLKVAGDDWTVTDIFTLTTKCHCHSHIGYVTYPIYVCIPRRIQMYIDLYYIGMYTYMHTNIGYMAYPIYVCIPRRKKICIGMYHVGVSIYMHTNIGYVT